MTLTRNLVALDDARIRANRVECARIRAKIRKVESAQRQVDALPVEMLTRKSVAAAGVLALIRPDVFGETVKAHIKRADAYNRSCAADAPAETAAAAAAAAEVGALCAAETSAAALKETDATGAAKTAQPKADSDDDSDLYWGPC